MPHLTPEEIERFARRESASPARGKTADHLAACARCRREVEGLRDVIAFLEGLGPASAHRWICGGRRAAGRPRGRRARSSVGELPEWSPAPSFANDVLAHVDLPHPALDRALSRLRTWSPAPAFASAVMARVRLPVPWPERLLRFARRRRAALATAGAAMLTVSGGAAAWLFGAQGLAPGQLARRCLQRRANRSCRRHARGGPPGVPSRTRGRGRIDRRPDQPYRRARQPGAVESCRDSPRSGSWPGCSGSRSRNAFASRGPHDPGAGVPRLSRGRASRRRAGGRHRRRRDHALRRRSGRVVVRTGERDRASTSFRGRSRRGGRNRDRILCGARRPGERLA